MQLADIFTKTLGEKLFYMATEVYPSLVELLYVNLNKESPIGNKLYVVNIKGIWFFLSPTTLDHIFHMKIDHWSVLPTFKEVCPCLLQDLF